MGSPVVMKMTDEQKQEIINAKDGEIFCTSDRMGQLYEGRVNVKRSAVVSGIIARTGAIYNDDAEALDNAELIVEEILGKEPKKKPAKKKKNGTKKKKKPAKKKIKR